VTTACIIAAVCIFILGLFAVIADRQAEIDRLREAAERAGRERDAAETEARIATELLAQREAERRRAGLRVVQSPIPMQRRGEEWDEIVRAVEGEQP
jgi:hypothetical protein